MRKLALLTALMLSAAMLCSCSDDASSSGSAAQTSASSGSSYALTDSSPASATPINAMKACQTIDPPAAGEEYVIMTIKDYGTVKIKVYKDLCPNSSNNFLGLVSQGFYNGLIFHRVVKDFVVQGGDPLGTGIGGKSYFGDPIDGEFSDSLIHMTGAVAYARASNSYSSKSQFYFVTGQALTAEALQYYTSQTGTTYTDECIDAYVKNGGVPYLDGQYVVFGQVFEGLDVVKRIQEVSVNGSSKPKQDVVIEKAEIALY